MRGAQSVQILVRGRLGPELAAALEGFELAAAPDGCTRLSGTVPDQARLLGVLEMLDELHIEVVSVNPAPAEGV